jgi:hypothetical protein
MADFGALYYPTRCLIQNHDPYMQSEVLRIYQAEEGNGSSDRADVRQIATQNVYPPTALFFTLPFAMLSLAQAQIFWMTLIAGGLIFSAFLIWNLGASYEPVISGCLIGFLLANSETLIVTGNAAGIVISLCAVAVWCFFRERFVLAGILCLAVGLVIKPHDSGLVWLFFLLAGGVYRKRALQTLLVALLVSLPALLWVGHVSPNWLQEWHTNISAFSAHGGINDPGLASSGGHGLDMMISLQSAISFFRDDPRIYNPVSYLICAPILAVWAFVTVRSRITPARTWLALAIVSALSMLPVYHRQLDAKLLLLSVPACAMLWAKGGRVGRFALAINFAALTLTGDLPWVVILNFIGHLPATSSEFTKQMAIAVQVMAAPLILLVMGIFYLWVYARRA